jgi:hypothetical protein
MTFMLEPTPDPGQTPRVQRVSLWQHQCFDAADDAPAKVTDLAASASGADVRR